MRFKITGIDAAGNEDSLVIEGDSVEELRAMAEREVKARGWVDYWSEQI